MRDVHEPIGGLDPVLVNHDVNVWSAPSVVSGVNGGDLHHAIAVRVPATSEPGLLAIEPRIIPAVVAGCIG